MRQLFFLALLSASACSSSSTPDETLDPGQDASTGADAGSSDAGSSDGGVADGGVREVDAAAYLDTCTTSADCVVVQAGDVCNPCPAGSFDLALNVASEAAYDQAFAALKAGCPSTAGMVMACPNNLTFTAAVCTAGHCAVCTTPGCNDADAGDAGH